MIYNVEVEVADDGRQEDPVPRPSRPPGSSTAGASFSYSGGTLEDQPSAYGGEGYGVEAPAQPVAAEPVPEPAVAQRRVDEAEQVGRNEPCWCGSGKKYKKCHGA